MPYDGELCYEEESFNSFLAGVLLKEKKIDELEFCKLMGSFERKYKVDINGVGNEFYLPIYLEGNEIRLLKNYDDVILINGKNITVKNYLYSVTSSRVREFFELPSFNEEIAVKKSNSLVRKLLFRNKIAI